MIPYSQWLNNWRFFCLLCNRFELCIRYVDDAIDCDGNLYNGSTYSNEFCDLLLSTSAEFENVAKQICKAIDKNFDEKKSDIADYTRIIVGRFSKIGTAMISSPVQDFYPLSGWGIIGNSIVGIDWWKAHNSIKHQRYTNFSQASFQNCYNALASLFVLELYAVKFVPNKDPVLIISSNPCRYFSSQYYFDLIFPRPKELPDFEK